MGFIIYKKTHHHLLDDMFGLFKNIQQKRESKYIWLLIYHEKINHSWIGI